VTARHYQSSYNKLPPGMDVQHTGVLAYLLPYIEQQAAFNNYSFAASKGGFRADGKTPAILYYFDPLNRPPTTSTDVVPRPPVLYGCEPVVPSYRCPSADNDIGSTNTALMCVDYGNPGNDYNAASGGNSHVFSSAPGRMVLARSNYLGVGGYYAPSADSTSAQFRGFYTYLSKTSIAKVPDGTSNTLMFMEYAGGFTKWGGSGGIPDGWSTGHWSAGFNYLGFGLDTQLLIADGNHGWWSFGSKHAGGIINSDYGDGSVRQINPNLDFNTLIALGGVADGQVVQNID
jgi:hypothetical protein